MTYTSTDAEARFLLKEVLNFEQVQRTDRFADTTDDMVTAILAEAGKMCEAELAPLNRNGDLNPAYLENGVVRTSPGFKDGYKAIAEGGCCPYAQIRRKAVWGFH